MLKINASWDSPGRRVHSVKLEGSLDEHTISQLRELSEVIFDEKGFSEGDHFLIDLTQVTEIDHVGFAALVGIMLGLAVKAGSFGLILPEEHLIRRTLRVTGLDRVFEVHETDNEAHEMIFALHY